jgi:hypothetical protein
MKNLDNLIRENREAFDTEEPDSGHFARFEARLEAASGQRPSAFNRFTMLKVAALILVLISVSVFIFDLATREIRERFTMAGSSSDLPLELREAMQYYNGQAELQLVKIRSLASNNEQAGELSKNALKEIASLDHTTGDLESELNANPGNEHIQAAIILNQQMKEGILNNIVLQLTQKNN